MAVRVPLVLISGSFTELPEGDTLPASSAISPGGPFEILQTNSAGTAAQWSNTAYLSGALTVNSSGSFYGPVYFGDSVTLSGALVGDTLSLNDLTVTTSGFITYLNVGVINSGVWQGTPIADTKLQTISTAGKVSNSATTATSANTANAIVARDASGGFTATVVTANLSGVAASAASCTGNSATATKLSSSRTFALTGDVTGSVSSDLTSGASISTAIAAGSIVDADINASAAIADTKLATISTAGKVANSATTATSANTANAIVARDASGNFSAGTITAALAGNANTATSATSATTATTAGALSSARTFALTGDVTGSVSSDLTSGASIATSIAAGSIVDADVNASAAIAGTKISPNFGSQTVGTTGNVGAGTAGPGTRFDAYVAGTGSSVIRARNDGTTVYLDANNGYSYLNTFTNHPMLFGVNNSERFRISTTGSSSFVNGSFVQPQTDNAMGLGLTGARWTSVWAANGTIQTSDERAKTEIADSALGTSFIKALRPVSFKWIEGGKKPTGELDDENNWLYESVPGSRTHWGFIAQEVKAAIDSAGVDFGGWILSEKEDPDSTQALRYDQFIAPLTKALQEALERIEILETKVAVLESA